MQHEFRTSEALLTSYVPGTQYGDLLDSFITPIIADVKQLKRRIDVQCFDDTQRLIISFAIIFSTYLLDVSKITG